MEFVKCTQNYSDFLWIETDWTEKMYNRKQPPHIQKLYVVIRTPSLKTKDEKIGLEFSEYDSHECDTRIFVCLKGRKKKSPEKMTRQTFGSRIRLISTIAPVYARVVFAV